MNETKGDMFRDLSKKAIEYNLRDDLVGEMVMGHLKDEAKEINQFNKRRGNKTVKVR